MTKKLIFFFTRVSDLEISFLVITFDPVDQNQKTKNQY